MPEFSLTGHADAPVEDIWKLLFDPTHFPQWWAGVETVKSDGPDSYTHWPTGYPDFPMPQKIHTDHPHGRVMISCQVSDLNFTWQLAQDGPGTTITVHARLPETEAHRLDTQRETLTTSLRQLAALAERGAR